MDTRLHRGIISSDIHCCAWQVGCRQIIHDTDEARSAMYFPVPFLLGFSPTSKALLHFRHGSTAPFRVGG
ncbi:hypothetical protein I7I48_11010 [Histoplasma ohiense]|nr:hypothetical protein I7I48_11010 [Histoplasma ohiense (nom. inval.)]